MKHLVTGGSGFLGNLIARRLLERGEKVRVLDIWEDPSRPKEIEFVNCDIRNREGVRSALQGIDMVHHNVALVPLTKSGGKFWEVNVEGSKICAEESVRAGVKGFIHMSSSAVFGLAKEMPINEKTPFRPIEIYGRGKRAGEIAVREICEKAKLPWVIIRPRTLLGQGRLGIFQILFDWIRENRKIYILGNGNHQFQFLHALDLMDAYMLAYDKGRSGAYNLGTDRFGTLRETLEHVIQYAESTSKVTPVPAAPAIAALQTLDFLKLSPLAPWHYLTYHKPFYFELDPIKSLGWKPKYSNDEMFRESYDWFIANRLTLQEGKRSAHRSRVKESLLGLLKKLS